jgi:uncharacterized membrane protein YidH (DUF202 family)
VSLPLAAIPLAASSAHGHSWLWVFGIVLIAIGSLHAVNPAISWRMSRWQYRDKQALEPSAAGLLAIRVSGVISVAIGVALLIVGISSS